MGWVGRQQISVHDSEENAKIQNFNVCADMQQRNTRQRSKSYASLERQITGIRRRRSWVSSLWLSLAVQPFCFLLQPSVESRANAVHPPFSWVPPSLAGSFQVQQDAPVLSRLKLAKSQSMKLVWVQQIDAVAKCYLHLWCLLSDLPVILFNNLI